MSNEKTLGYVLLSIGIVIIVFSAINVFQVFTKQIQPIQLFAFPAIGLDASTLLGGEAGQLARGNKMEILPASVLNESSNIFAHMFLMGFFATIGHKIASLGIMLVRTIEVKVRGNEKTN